ncbi:secreted RxLR effector protein 78-like [Lactuca sativa]|uniref:secreted RxLR effector protein 78-like n=1 Tax=Lactuca sativa TaxID=4236 RepID=UPI001C688BC2|nr:secreted RxLR effector protein 78-like [Lactuca sativa]
MSCQHATSSKLTNYHDTSAGNRVNRSSGLLLLKVDFEKAYDSLYWDYLLEIMSIMGFRSKWCQWIKELLSTARASVLINGSLTDEFQIHRGLRQGDPLSPFLFILAMEGLHITLTRARAANAFRGVSISGTENSHLMYADDVMLITP